MGNTAKQYRLGLFQRVDSQGEHYKGIHDRFLRDRVYRESQLSIGWTEQVHRDGRIGKERSQVPSLNRGIQKIPRTRYLTLNKLGKNAPMRLRPDLRAAVSQKPCSS